jgi:hypothetical protein
MRELFLNLRAGMLVRSAEGTPIGHLVLRDGEVVVIEGSGPKGQARVLREEDVARVTGNEAHLRLSVAQLRDDASSDWDEGGTEPTGWEDEGGATRHRPSNEDR